MYHFAGKDRETFQSVNIIAKRLFYSVLWNSCARTPNPHVFSPCGRRVIICLKLNFSGWPVGNVTYSTPWLTQPV